MCLFIQVNVHHNNYSTNIYRKKNDKIAMEFKTKAKKNKKNKKITKIIFSFSSP